MRTRVWGLLLLLAIAGPARADEPPVRVKVVTLWYKDWLAPLLVAAGGVVILAAGVDYGDQRLRLDHANDSWTRHEQALGAPSHVIADSVAMGVGAALVAGGALRWILVDRRARRQRAFSLGAGVDGHGAQLTLGGVF